MIFYCLNYLNKISFFRFLHANITAQFALKLVGQFAPEWLVSLLRNGWSVCSGIVGQFAPEWLVSLLRNDWSVCSGIVGQFAPEYSN